MADTGSAKAASAAEEPWFPSTDPRRSSFFAHVQASRERIGNHPGHTDQKSHGRKGSAGGDGAGQGRIGPKASKLDRVADPGDRRAQAMGANPGYGQGYRGPQTGEPATYTQNCTRVAIAYELRRRGLDVTAGAGTPSGDNPAAYVRTFREDGKYAVRVDTDLSRSMSAKEIATEVESWPHGARGIVTMDGHTLNVERDASTGKAVFVDSQAAGRRQPVMTTAAFTRRAQSRGAETDKHMAVARVDDLDVSDYGLRYVEGKGLDIAAGQVGKTQYPSPPGTDRRPTDEELATMTPDDSYP